MKRNLNRALLSVLVMLLASCSSSDSGNGGDGNSDQPDLVMMNMIDQETGFMSAFSSTADSTVSSARGVELDPATGIMTHDGHVYTVGSLNFDNVVKYSLDNGTFVKEGEFITGEGARAGSIFFISDSKAYVVAYHRPELIIFNPQTMQKTGAIDISSYAIGSASDTNPNATGGVIRNGKLFLGLAQIDTFQTFYCQAGASMLIIDVATDTVEKHIQDSRACMSGALEPGTSIFMDELGDIYVNHYGSYGYYPGLTAGYLRIKAGAEEFDPNYFFSFTDLDLTGEVPGGKVSYLYRPSYAGDGVVYGNFWVPALSSNPPDYVNDKNYMAYKVDLRNKTVSAIDIPPSTGWSASNVVHDGNVIFARTTDAGAGLYFYDPSSGSTMGDQTPSITTDGNPVWIERLK